MKKNKSIFFSKTFDLPQQRGEKDFYDFIANSYDKFLKTVETFNGELSKLLKPRLPLIQSQVDSILEVIQLQYKGFPSLAYATLSKTLNSLNKEKVLPISHKAILHGNHYYRIRISESNSLEKGDMFHIPYQLRERVSTQRYSIPGFPCLYMADSVFVCWEELARPNLDNLHVARFDISDARLKFLYFNLSVTSVRDSSFAKSDDGQYLNQLVNFLSYWPLYAVCSMIVQQPFQAFKPEYIIPQMLLQWLVKDGKIDGILYKSNRVSIHGQNVGTFTNAVIPSKQIAPTGFCPILRKKIKFTNPISWQLLDIAEPSKRNVSNDDLDIADLRRAAYVELIQGEKSNYLKTKFGILEEKLKNINLEFLD